MNTPLDNPSAEIQQAWRAALAEQLDTRRGQHLLRELREADAFGPKLILQGREYLQFASNNYLGLAQDPEVIDAAQAATARFGTGAGASRLVTGSLAIHHELETALARFKHAEAALLFPTGYMANLAVLTTFAGEGDVIVSDKLNHASLLDGAGYCGARHRTFPHLRYPRARELLLHEKGTRRFLVTDTVFSMDGDVADLPAACDAAEAGGGLVILDEAHATGVLGPRGGGLAEQQHVEERIALSVGTLSKALGSVGGFVTGPRVAIDTLINAARSFVYTTALPPACAAAALAALRIVAREPARRQRVLALAGHVRQSLEAMGFDCGRSVTPIIPVILGDAERVVGAAASLRDRGIFVPAIRPPTVAPKTARLRISVMATHSDAHVEQLLAAMKTLRASHPPAAD